MDSAPIIDRKRLERYPLDSHPLPAVVVIVLSAGTYLTWQSLLALKSASAPSFGSAWWSSKWFLAPPFLLTLGTIAGIVMAWVTYDFRARRSDVQINAYFLTRETRIRAHRNKNGSIVFGLFVGLFVSLILIATPNIRIAVFSAATGYLLACVPEFVADHRELVRRRQIALAWDGNSPPNNRLTVAQRIYVFLTAAIVFALELGAVYYICGLWIEVV
jgi:hypothetical protein